MSVTWDVHILEFQSARGFSFRTLLKHVEFFVINCYFQSYYSDVIKKVSWRAQNVGFFTNKLGRQRVLCLACFLGYMRVPGAVWELY